MSITLGRIGWESERQMFRQSKKSMPIEME
jgi:hypothetical protein